MTTLAESLAQFILARITEDEATFSQWPDDAPRAGMVDTMGRPIWTGRRRGLAECQAKWRIVAFADEITGMDLQIESEFGVGPRNEASDPYAGDILLLYLAAPYADHPDFDPAWRIEGQE